MSARQLFRCAFVNHCYMRGTSSLQRCYNQQKPSSNFEICKLGLNRQLFLNFRSSRHRLQRFLRRGASCRRTCPVVSGDRSRLGVSGEKARFAGQHHRQHQVQFGGHRNKAESLENADGLAEAEPWLRFEGPGTGTHGGGVGTFGRQILPRNGDLSLVYL